ncbi:hypothetical protein [Arhodomonas sp. SL1]|uniref:hypothetical protein n=1 Tax=Arhodomonas sp. SL1 TaxID=3425691 RepID=UPI003F881736
MKRKISVTLAALALAGCQALPEHAPPPEPEPEPAQRSAVEGALGAYRRSAGLPEDELRRRLERALSAGRPDVCDAEDLRAAALLLRLPADDSVPEREAVLGDCLETGTAAETPAVDLAALLERALVLQAGHRNAQDELAGLRQEARQLREDNERLGEKLDGLKAIEENLQERERLRNGS